MTNGHGGLRPGAGRPRLLTDYEVTQAARAITRGQPILDVASALGVHRTTLARALKRTHAVTS